MQDALNALPSLIGMTASTGASPACSALSVTFAELAGPHDSMHIIMEDGAGQKTVAVAARSTPGTVQAVQTIVLRCSLDAAAVTKTFRFNVSSTNLWAYTPYINPSSSPADLKAAIDAVS